MSDPVRLLSSSRDGVARALLHSASAPDPTSDQRDALWSSIASKLPGAVVSGAAGGAAGAALAKAATSKAVGAGMLLKGAIVVGVLGSMAAVGIARPWLSHPEASPEAAPRASASPAPPPLAPVVVPVPPAPVAPAPVMVDPAPQPVAPRSPVPRAFATRRAPSAAAEIDTPSPVAAVGTPPPAENEAAMALHDESASLIRSRQLLRSGACGQALAQLQQGSTRFPAGALAQEREVLTIEALACGGRATEASTRAEAFVRANPSSVHVSKVRRFTRP